MKRFAILAVTLPVLALGACTSTSNPQDGTSSTPSVSSVPMQETQNVTYQGTLQAAGTSIFMEGTHKLQLEDGRFIMLESSDVDLNQYLGMKVELFGAVRPTVEAGGMIMRVQRVTSMEPSSSSSMMDSSSSETSISSVSSESSMTSTSSVSSEAASSKQSSLAQSSSKASVMASSMPSVASSVAAASSVAFEGSAELTDKAALMAKDNMGAGFWTQQYCTKTAAYCVSVHKNWYFKSFGATSATLWHVEVGPQEINNIGEGPLTINLISGSVESTQSIDGQVRVLDNNTVVAYKAWTENRHFEIRGPANLEAAITFMLGTIKAN